MVRCDDRITKSVKSRSIFELGKSKKKPGKPKAILSRAPANLFWLIRTSIPRIKQFKLTNKGNRIKNTKVIYDGCSKIKDEMAAVKVPANRGNKVVGRILPRS